MHWILILTLFTGSGASVTTAEFKYETKCEEAGMAWLNQVTKVPGLPAHGLMLCVRNK